MFSFSCILVVPLSLNYFQLTFLSPPSLILCTSLYIPKPTPPPPCSLSYFFSFWLLQVKKHQQAVVGFLEANRISFQEIDITMLEEQRLWMYRNIPRDKMPEKGNPLPPQIFNEDCYCGV